MARIFEEINTESYGKFKFQSNPKNGYNEHLQMIWSQEDVHDLSFEERIAFHYQKATWPRIGEQSILRSFWGWGARRNQNVILTIDRSE